MAQWLSIHLPRRPPTNVARVRFPDSASNVGWVCCWFSSLLREVFLRVWNSIWNSIWNSRATGLSVVLLSGHTVVLSILARGWKLSILENITIEMKGFQVFPITLFVSRILQNILFFLFPLLWILAIGVKIKGQLHSISCHLEVYFRRSFILYRRKDSHSYLRKQTVAKQKTKQIQAWISTHDHCELYIFRVNITFGV